MPVLEIRDLTQADANQAADDLRIDADTVDVVAQGDGKFTVRATYPEGAVIPKASTASDRDPFALNGLNQAAADAEVAFFRDSDATVDVVPEAGGLFTVQITPAKPPLLIQPPPAPAAPNAPDLGGYVFCLDRIRTERRPGKAFDRTVSRYQAYFNRTPVVDIFGMAVERQGPGDNTQTGVDQHRRLAAGTYPLFTHASGDTNKYRTIGYNTPVNQPVRPWPCVGIENTGTRSGVLIHCAAGYLMSIGCINLASNIANAQSNVVFSDSWSRVVALIDSIKANLGGAFPNGNNVRLPNSSLVIRE
jgi:hypothetical protein